MTNQYDKIANQYHAETSKDFLNKDDKGREKFKVEMIDRPRIKRADGWHVLDLGCGSGIHVEYFVETHPEINAIIGIDSSVEMIKIAKNNNKTKKVKFIIADMDDIPFKNNTFDYIFSRNSIHYSADLQKTFAEISRVLKPGGKLYFQVSDPIYNLFTKKNKDYIKKENVGFAIQGGNAIVVHPTYTFEEYINSIVRNNLNILEMHEYCGRKSNIEGFNVPVVLSFLITKGKEKL
ncbi:MAG: class I SAM-dependent methyltransferase [Patescibacteria group bacterium]|jgi:ubiquinone/menaquinone biosynthesis C-methylase UbiE